MKGFAVCLIAGIAMGVTAMWLYYELRVTPSSDDVVQAAHVGFQRGRDNAVQAIYDSLRTDFDESHLGYTLKKTAFRSKFFQILIVETSGVRTIRMVPKDPP